MSWNWRKVVRAAVYGIAAANILFASWHTRVLTFERPLQPTGNFTIPYPSHGTVEYITRLDSWVHWSVYPVHLLAALLWGLTMIPSKQGNIGQGQVN